MVEKGRSESVKVTRNPSEIAMTPDLYHVVLFDAVLLSCRPVGVYVYKPSKEVILIMKRFIAYFLCEVALFKSVNGLKVFPQGIHSEYL